VRRRSIRSWSAVSLSTPRGSLTPSPTVVPGPLALRRLAGSAPVSPGGVEKSHKVAKKKVDYPTIPLTGQPEPGPRGNTGSSAIENLAPTFIRVLSRVPAYTIHIYIIFIFLGIRLGARQLRAQHTRVR
jgi:hypothetical protein